MLTNVIISDQGKPFATLEAWLQRQEDSIDSLAGQDPAAKGGFKWMAHRCVDHCA